LFLLLPLRFRFLQHVQEQKANDARKTLSRTVKKRGEGFGPGKSQSQSQRHPFPHIVACGYLATSFGQPSSKPAHVVPAFLTFAVVLRPRSFVLSIVTVTA